MPEHKQRYARNIKWAYGVMTCSARRITHLPKTLNSLRAAGFDEPHLFVDGDNDSKSWAVEFGLDVTCRFPRVNVYGNWMMSILELFIRHPEAERYLLFQDDLITYRNLRAYLDQLVMEDKTYLNLYTVPANQALAPERIGWYPSNQMGKGALALAFNREGLIQLCSARQFVERPVDPKRGWRNVDGGIIHTLKALGYKEMVHNPSLVQHTGLVSSMDKRKHSDGSDQRYIVHQWEEKDLANSFRGENFDALGFTPCKEAVTIPPTPADSVPVLPAPSPSSE